MKVIGLLGGVASGKSTVANALARRGADKRGIRQLAFERELDRPVEHVLARAIVELRDDDRIVLTEAQRFGSRGGPSILSPNNARTRVGRALADFCNALTGGFGISLGGLSLGSVCAEPGESAKLFAHLKPAYLRSRPVCTEVEPAGAGAKREPEQAVASAPRSTHGGM